MYHGIPFFQGSVGVGRSQGARQMFSPDEDAHLKELVDQLGEHDWKNIARRMPNRTTRQCRERYKNYLAPRLSNAPWTTEEDNRLRAKHTELGPKWAQIASYFKGRSDVSVKNHWTSLMGKNASKQKSEHDTTMTEKSPVNSPFATLQGPISVQKECETISPPCVDKEEKSDGDVDVLSAIRTIRPVTLQDFSDPLPPLIVKEPKATKSDNTGIAQLLWGSQERGGMLRVEEVALKNENAGLENTFPGYGGHIW